MPRHQLTTEERRKAAAATNAKHKANGWAQQKAASEAALRSPKRHKLTHKDRVNGGRRYHPSETRHTLTPEERRRGGLATAALRQLEAEEAHQRLALIGARIGYEHEQRTGERVLTDKGRAMVEAAPCAPPKIRDASTLVRPERAATLAGNREEAALRAAKLFGLFCGCTPDGPSLACQAEGLWHGLKVTARNRAEVNEKTAERAAALPTGPLEIRPEVDELLDDPDPHTPGCAYAGDANVAGCCEGYPLLKELRKEAELGPREGSIFGPYERISADKLNEGGAPSYESLTITTPAPDVFATDVKAMAEKLISTPYAELETLVIGALRNGSLSPDPFTLSALKRFRLGPLSPLALTRSQRAHVDIMLAGGWVEKTPEAMIRLTAKGEAALNATENE